MFSAMTFMIMIMIMIVFTACGLLNLIKLSLSHLSNNNICTSRNSRKYLYAALFKHILSTFSNTSAYQNVDIILFKEICQSAMTIRTRTQNLSISDRSALNFVYFKFLGLTEMLENITFVVCYSYPHNITLRSL